MLSVFACAPRKRSSEQRCAGRTLIVVYTRDVKVAYGPSTAGYGITISTSRPSGPCTPSFGGVKGKAMATGKAGGRCTSSSPSQGRVRRFYGRCSAQAPTTGYFLTGVAGANGRLRSLDGHRNSERGMEFGDDVVAVVQRVARKVSGTGSRAAQSRARWIACWRDRPTRRFGTGRRLAVLARCPHPTSRRAPGASRSSRCSGSERARARGPPHVVTCGLARRGRRSSAQPGTSARSSR